MAERPALADVVRLARSMRQGSAVDPQLSFLGALRELRNDTAPGSPLTMRQLLERPDYRDLRTAKIRVGDPAFDFQLPRYDFSSESASAPAAATVRLSDFRDVQPVALIFGSYT